MPDPSLRGEGVVALIRAIDATNEAIGRVLGWAALLLILVQFALVLGAAAFAFGSIWLQESRLYLNALIFLAGAGYTLKHDGHVRVDPFYRGADPIARAWVDFVGTLIFLAPVLFLIWWVGAPFVLDSWAIREGSTETGGIPFVYGLKTTVLLFAGTLSLQAIAVLLRGGLRIFCGGNGEA